MINEYFKAKARKHWTKWLPEKVAQLKADGQLDAALQVAANLARARVDELMAQGYRRHEAEEVALSEFVLLRPEPAAGLEPWEREELAEKERAYQAQMAREREIEREADKD